MLIQSVYILAWSRYKETIQFNSFGKNSSEGAHTQRDGVQKRKNRTKEQQNEGTEHSQEKRKNTKQIQLQTMIHSYAHASIILCSVFCIYAIVICSKKSELSLRALFASYLILNNFISVHLLSVAPYISLKFLVHCLFEWFCWCGRGRSRSLDFLFFQILFNALMATVAFACKFWLYRSGSTISYVTRYIAMPFL